MLYLVVSHPCIYRLAMKIFWSSLGSFLFGRFQLGLLDWLRSSPYVLFDTLRHHFYHTLLTKTSQKFISESLCREINSCVDSSTVSRNMEKRAIFFNKSTTRNPTYALKDIKKSPINTQSSFLTLQFAFNFQ